MEWPEHVRMAQELCISLFQECHCFELEFTRIQRMLPVGPGLFRSPASGSVERASEQTLGNSATGPRLRLWEWRIHVVCLQCAWIPTADSGRKNYVVYLQCAWIPTADSGHERHVPFSPASAQKESDASRHWCDHLHVKPRRHGASLFQSSVKDWPWNRQAWTDELNTDGSCHFLLRRSLASWSRASRSTVVWHVKDC